MDRDPAAELHGRVSFDDNASAVRGFPNAMLGYDKKAVDDYIRDMERQLTLARHQFGEVQHELTAALTPGGRHGFQQAGAHTANLRLPRTSLSMMWSAPTLFRLGRADRAGESRADRTRMSVGHGRGRSAGRGHRVAARPA